MYSVQLDNLYQTKLAVWEENDAVANTCHSELLSIALVAVQLVCLFTVYNNKSLFVVILHHWGFVVESQIIYPSRSASVTFISHTY